MRTRVLSPHSLLHHRLAVLLWQAWAARPHDSAFGTPSSSSPWSNLLFAASTRFLYSVGEIAPSLSSRSSPLIAALRLVSRLLIAA
ncbi:hypothetical protein [Ktedonospora formicarum]|uniref:hypothetical protein n=1 Tax=Ktedonospora formicarum TaxID=2778364 RepID=UPI001C6927BC|nr:hypothetical protein [Ktedonospora formicarum]